MNRTKFKTLMYNNHYVDEYSLHKGIYIREIPILYKEDKTIEELIFERKSLDVLIGKDFYSDTYFDNLEKCQLIDVTITI